MKKQNEHLLLLCRIARALQRCFFLFPLKRDRVLFYLVNRRGYTCNPKYIAEYLASAYSDAAEIVFVSDYPDTCEEITEKGFKVISSGTIKFFWYYSTAAVIVTNDAWPAYFFRRKSQLSINTWHGGINYKHIGFAYLGINDKTAYELFKLKNQQPDIFISGSGAFTKDTSESFGFNQEVFLNCGLPRNDVFFNDFSGISSRVRIKYEVPADYHIVLYAPTFRQQLKSETYGIDICTVLSALNNRFGSKWILFYRGHPFLKALHEKKELVDVSEHGDMQELLCAAEVLISDYSSCMWDYILTKRPCFVYAPDRDKYDQTDRSFAIPIEKWPYPVAMNNAELSRAIEHFDEEDYLHNISKHHQEMESFDRGTASKVIADIIYNAIHIEKG